MSKKSNRNGRRGNTLSTANRRLPTLSPSNPWAMSDYSLLSEVEDRRTYHPDGPVRSPRDVRGLRVSTSAAPRPPKDPWAATPSRVAFSVPQEVLVCVRRKQRKEVLHALNKTGKSGQKRPHRNYFSDIQC